MFRQIYYYKRQWTPESRVIQTLHIFGDCGLPFLTLKRLLRVSCETLRLAQTVMTTSSRRYRNCHVMYNSSRDLIRLIDDLTKEQSQSTHAHQPIPASRVDHTPFLKRLRTYVHARACTRLTARTCSASAMRRLGRKVLS